MFSTLSVLHHFKLDTAAAVGILSDELLFVVSKLLN